MVFLLSFSVLPVVFVSVVLVRRTIWVVHPSHATEELMLEVHLAKSKDCCKQEKQGCSLERPLAFLVA